MATQAQLLQELFILATGRPANTPNLAALESIVGPNGDLHALDHIINSHMNARESALGTAGIVQAVARTALGRTITIEQANGAANDLKAAGLDTWAKIFHWLANDESALTTALNNRGDAAVHFTTELQADGKYDLFEGQIIWGAATTLIQAIDSSTQSLTNAKSGLSELSDALSADGIQSAVVDGYVAGATVFVDANGNGQLDDGEWSSTTDASGNYTLPNDAPVGTIVATGGIDIMTNKPFQGVLTAPSGSTVVNPLTTMVQTLVESGENIASATATVTAALGLPADVNPLSFDPIKVLQDPNASPEARETALSVQSTALQVANVITQAANALTSASGTGTGNTLVGAATSVADALAAALLANKNSGTQLDLTNSTTLTTIVQTAATNNSATTGVAVSPTLLTQVSTIMSDNNAQASKATTFTDLSKAAVVAQGDAVDAIKTGANSGNLGEAVTKFSGAGLETAVLNATGPGLPPAPAPTPTPSPTPTPAPTFTVTEDAGVVSFSGTATGDISIVIDGDEATFTRQGVTATTTVEDLAADDKTIELAANQILALDAEDIEDEAMLGVVIDGEGTVKTTEGVRIADLATIEFAMTSGNFNVQFDITLADSALNLLDDDFFAAEGSVNIEVTGGATIQQLDDISSTYVAGEINSIELISDTATHLLADIGDTGFIAGDVDVHIDDTSIAASDLATLNSNTTGLVDASDITTITGTPDELIAAYNFPDTEVEGLGDEDAVTSGTTATTAQLNTLAAKNLDGTINANSITTLTGAGEVMTALFYGEGNSFATDVLVILDDTELAPDTLIAINHETTTNVNANSIVTLIGGAGNALNLYNNSTGITGLGDEAVTLNDTELDATTLASLNTKTSGTIDANSIDVLTGVIDDVTDLYNDTTGISNLGNADIDLTDATLGGADVVSLLDLTSGFINAPYATVLNADLAQLETLFEEEVYFPALEKISLTGMEGIVSADDLLTLSTNASGIDIDLSDMDTISGSASEVLDLTGPSGFINLNHVAVELSGTVSVENASDIADFFNGIVTATIETSTAEVLATTLSEAGNKFTITISDGDVGASHLASIKAKTTLDVDATAVTNITGGAPEIIDIYAGGFTGLGNESLNVNASTLTADVNTILDATTGGVTLLLDPTYVSGSTFNVGDGDIIDVDPDNNVVDFKASPEIDAAAVPGAGDGAWHFNSVNGLFTWYDSLSDAVNSMTLKDMTEIEVSGDTVTMPAAEFSVNGSTTLILSGGSGNIEMTYADPDFSFDPAVGDAVSKTAAGVTTINIPGGRQLTGTESVLNMVATALNGSITVTGPSPVTASIINALDGKTSGLVTVTPEEIQGTTLEVKTAAQAAGIVLTENFAATLSGSADATDILALNGETEGAINGAGITALSGAADDVLDALTALDTDPTSFDVTVTDTADAAHLLSIAGTAGLGTFSLGGITTLTASADADISALDGGAAFAETLNVNAFVTVTMSGAQHIGFTTINAAGGFDQITLVDNAGGANIVTDPDIATYSVTEGSNVVLGAATTHAEQNITETGSNDIVSTFTLGTGTYTGAWDIDALDVVRVVDGTNIAGISGFNSGVTLDLQNEDIELTLNATQNGVVSFLNFNNSQTIKLSEADNFTAADNIETYSIVGASTVAVQQGTNITGDGGTQTINVAGLSPTGNYVLGGGTDIIVATDGANLTGINSGNATSAGALNITGGITMTRDQAAGLTLVSGEGTGDSIAITTAGSVSANSQIETYNLSSGGANSINISGNEGVNVNGSANFATTITINAGNTATGDYNLLDDADVIVAGNGANIAGINAGEATTAENLEIDGTVTMKAAQHNGFGSIGAADGNDQITLIDAATLTTAASVGTYQVQAGSIVTVSSTSQVIVENGDGESIFVLGAGTYTGVWQGIDIDDTVRVSGNVDISGNSGFDATGVKVDFQDGAATLTITGALAAGEGQYLNTDNDGGTQTINVATHTDDTIAAHDGIESYILSDGLTLDAGAATNISSSSTVYINVGSQALSGTYELGGNSLISVEHGADLSDINGGDATSAYTLSWTEGSGTVSMKVAQHEGFTAINGNSETTIELTDAGTFNTNTSALTYRFVATSTLIVNNINQVIEELSDDGAQDSTIVLGANNYANTFSGLDGTDIIRIVDGSNIADVTGLNTGITIDFQGQDATLTMTQAQHDAAIFTGTDTGTQTIKIVGAVGDLQGKAGIESYIIDNDTDNVATFSPANGAQGASATHESDVVIFSLGNAIYTSTFAGMGAGADDTLFLVNGTDISGAQITNMSGLSLDTDAAVTLTASQYLGFAIFAGDGDETLNFTSPFGGSTTLRSVFETFVLASDDNDVRPGADGQTIDATALTNGKTLTLGAAAFAVNVALTNGDLSAATYTGALEVDVSNSLAVQINTGSGADNITIVSSGADGALVDAGGGDDIINGGERADTLTGGGGNDTLLGGDGNDVLVVDDGDAIDGGEGSNTARFAAAVSAVNLIDGDLQNVGEIEITNTGDAAYDFSVQSEGLTITGSSGNDTITGGGGNDVINGGDGNDSLIGGGGLDTLNGGNGNNIYVADQSDLITGGDNNDTVQFAESVATASFGDDDLTGVELIQITAGGNTVDLSAQNEALSVIGSNGSDTIVGAAGGGTLRGGAGIDHITGSTNIDTFIVSAADDDVGETYAAGADNDTLSVLGTDAVNFSDDTLSDFENLSMEDGGQVTFKHDQHDAFVDGANSLIGSQSITIAAGVFDTITGIAGIESYSVGKDNGDGEFTFVVATAGQSVTVDAGNSEVFFDIGALNYTGTLTSADNKGFLKMAADTSIVGATLTGIVNLILDGDGTFTMTQDQHSRFTDFNANGDEVQITLTTAGEVNTDYQFETYSVVEGSTVTIGTDAEAQDIIESGGAATKSTFILGTGAYTGTWTGIDAGDYIEVADGTNLAGITGLTVGTIDLTNANNGTITLNATQAAGMTFVNVGGSTINVVDDSAYIQSNLAGLATNAAQLGSIDSTEDATITLSAAQFTALGAKLSAGDTINVVDNSAAIEGALAGLVSNVANVDSIDSSEDEQAITLTAAQFAVLLSRLDIDDELTVNALAATDGNLTAMNANIARISSITNLTLTASQSTAEMNNLFGLTEDGSVQVVATGMSAEQLALVATHIDKVDSNGITGTLALSTTGLNSNQIEALLGEQTNDSATVNVDASSMDNNELSRVSEGIGKVDEITGLALTNDQNADEIGNLLGKAANASATVLATGMSENQLAAIADNIARIANDGITGILELSNTDLDASQIAALLGAKTSDSATVNVDASSMLDAELTALSNGIAKVTAIDNLTLTATQSTTEMGNLFGKSSDGTVTVDATGMTPAQLEVVVSNIAKVAAGGITGEMALTSALDSADLTTLFSKDDDVAPDNTVDVSGMDSAALDVIAANIGKIETGGITGTLALTSGQSDAELLALFGAYADTDATVVATGMNETAINVLITNANKIALDGITGTIDGTAFSAADYQALEDAIAAAAIVTITDSSFNLDGKTFNALNAGDQISFTGLTASFVSGNGTIGHDGNLNANGEWELDAGLFTYYDGVLKQITITGVNTITTTGSDGIITFAS